LYSLLLFILLIVPISFLSIFDIKFTWIGHFIIANLQFTRRNRALRSSKYRQSSNQQNSTNISILKLKIGDYESPWTRLQLPYSWLFMNLNSFEVIGQSYSQFINYFLTVFGSSIHLTNDHYYQN
jgi:hypothetical protein